MDAGREDPPRRTRPDAQPRDAQGVVTGEGHTVTCRACGYANPADHSLCFICGHAVQLSVPTDAELAGGPTQAQRQAYVASLAAEQGVVRLLRLLYLLYAVGYVLLTLSVVVAGQVAELPTPTRLLLTLQPVLSLVLVLMALRRLEEEPFAWALVMAGMETLALFQQVAVGTWKSPHTIAALLLWTAVFTCARTTGFRQAWVSGRTDVVPGIGDLRSAVALLLLYAGVFLIVLLPDPARDYETWRAVFTCSLVGLGIVAGAVAGHGVLRDSLRFRVSPSHLVPTLLALLVLVLADTLWISWARGDWIPHLPHLAWPGFELLLWIALVPGLVEEWLCRGVMWSSLRLQVAQGAGILATATLFALLHGLGRGGLSAVLPQLFAGVVFGVLRARTGSLVPCMVAHALGNLYVAAWIAGS